MSNTSNTGDKDYVRWVRKHKLGDLASPNNRRLYDNRYRTVGEYISLFRKGSIKSVLPGEVQNMSVDEALRQKIVGRRNIRKLLGDSRDKFE